MSKDEIICLIDLMIGLTDEETKLLKKKTQDDLEKTYALYLLEKNDEMLNDTKK